MLARTVYVPHTSSCALARFFGDEFVTTSRW
jgi:hypothetical protein